VIADFERMPQLNPALMVPREARGPRPRRSPPTVQQQADTRPVFAVGPALRLCHRREVGPGKSGHWQALWRCVGLVLRSGAVETKPRSWRSCMRKSANKILEKAPKAGGALLGHAVSLRMSEVVPLEATF
jgi:hypothetical protein